MKKYFLKENKTTDFSYVKAVDNLYILRKKHRDGYNIYNICNEDSNTYLLNKWSDHIKYIEKYNCFFVFYDDVFIAIDKNGKSVFNTDDGNPIYIEEIDDKICYFYSDPLCSYSDKKQYIIISSEDGSDFVYEFKNGKFVNIFKNVHVIKSYDEKDEELSDILYNKLIVKSLYSSEYNCITAKGEIPFKEWFNSYNFPSIDDSSIMIIDRGGKYNIINLPSMTPYLNDEDEWYDSCNYVDCIIDDAYKGIIVEKNNKFNILAIDENGVICTLLKRWADDISYNENTYIFLTYDNTKYLFMPWRSLVECDDAKIINDYYILITKNNKHNIIQILDKNIRENNNKLYTNWYDYIVDPIFKEWFDEIYYDNNDEFFTVRKGDKFAVVSDSYGVLYVNDVNELPGRSGNKRICWFDDVKIKDDCVLIQLNGKTYTFK